MRGPCGHFHNTGIMLFALLISPILVIVSPSLLPFLRFDIALLRRSFRFPDPFNAELAALGVVSHVTCACSITQFLTRDHRVIEMACNKYRIEALVYNITYTLITYSIYMDLNL